MLKAVAFGLAASIGYGAAAAAASCDALVERFAREEGLKAAAPAPPTERDADISAPSAVTDADRTTLTERLAESQGVIKPPPTGDPAVVVPPPTPDPMPTAPRVQPRMPSGPAPAGSVELDAATRAQAEALLLAAKAAADEGQEAQCLERLQAAQNLIKQASRSGR